MQLNVFHAAKNALLDVLLWSVGVGLLGANIVLLQQNRTLREAAVSGAAGNRSIEAGKHLGRYLAAATMDSALRPIAFPSLDIKRTLMITFSPGCPHCKANLKTWSVITKELRRKGGWRIVWLSRDPVELTKDYCEDFDIPIAEAFAEPTYRTYLVMDLKEVPNTVVVDEKGIVERVWRGELGSAGWEQIFDYLHIPIALMPSS